MAKYFVIHVVSFAQLVGNTISVVHFLAFFEDENNVKIGYDKFLVNFPV